MNLEDEIVIRDKQVMELTFKVQVREKDIGKKEVYNYVETNSSGMRIWNAYWNHNVKHNYSISQEDTYRLKKELEEVIRSIEEGRELDTVLRSSIDELTEEKKDIMVWPDSLYMFLYMHSLLVHASLGSTGEEGR